MKRKSSTPSPLPPEPADPFADEPIDVTEAEALITRGLRVKLSELSMNPYRGLTPPSSQQKAWVVELQLGESKAEVWWSSRHTTTTPILAQLLIFMKELSRIENVGQWAAANGYSLTGEGHAVWEATWQYNAAKRRADAVRAVLSSLSLPEKSGRSLPLPKKLSTSASVVVVKPALPLPEPAAKVTTPAAKVITPAASIPVAAKPSFNLF